MAFGTGVVVCFNFMCVRFICNLYSDDLMNYSVNIYEEGKVLSIVVQAGSRE